MATKNRPHRESKKKPKSAPARPVIQPLEAPPPTVEVIKPRRKPRELEEPEAE
jgi:hypothetical protein